MKKFFAASLVLALSIGFVGCKSDSKGEGDKPKAKWHIVAVELVSAPVTGALTKAFPTAKSTSWQEKSGNYRARGQDANAHWIEVQIQGDGTIKESAEQTAPDASPEPVKAAVAGSEYAKLAFVDGFKKVEPAKSLTYYKFVYKKGDDAVVAVYGADGKLVKEKPMPKDKLAKWQDEHAVSK